MTRDSKVWSVLLWIGIVVGVLSTVADPAYYGIPASWMPYIRLVALIVAAVGGKYGNSSLPGKIDTGKIASLLLIAALLVPATGCALKGTPRHQTTVAAVAISDSLIAATDFEREHWRDLTMTEAQHKAFQGHMVQVLTTAREVDKTVLAWPKGAAAPEGLRPLVLQLKADLDLALQLLPASATKDKVTTQLAAVWSLVGLVLGS